MEGEWAGSSLVLTTPANRSVFGNDKVQETSRMTDGGTKARTLTLSRLFVPAWTSNQGAGRFRGNVPAEQLDEMPLSQPDSLAFPRKRPRRAARRDAFASAGNAGTPPPDSHQVRSPMRPRSATVRNRGHGVVSVPPSTEQWVYEPLEPRRRRRRPHRRAKRMGATPAAVRWRGRPLGCLRA